MATQFTYDDTTEVGRLEIERTLGTTEQREPWQVVPDAPINQFRVTPTGAVVRRFGLIATDLVCYHAYRPWTGSYMTAPYSTTTMLDEDEIQVLGLQTPARLGLITSRRLPPELDALAPMTDARIDAVRAYQDALVREAYAEVHSVFSEVGPPQPGRDGHLVCGLENAVPGAALQGRIENWRRCAPEYRAVGSHSCIACGTWRGHHARGARRCRECVRLHVAPPS